MTSPRKGTETNNVRLFVLHIKWFEMTSPRKGTETRTTAGVSSPSRSVIV